MINCRQPGTGRRRARGRARERERERERWFPLSPNSIEKNILPTCYAHYSTNGFDSSKFFAGEKETQG